MNRLINEPSLINRQRISLVRIIELFGERRNRGIVNVDWRHDKSVLEAFDILGQEKVLRRLRLVDIVRAEPRVKTLCERLTHLPYPIVTNIALWTIMHGFEIDLSSYEITDSLETFRRQSGLISNYVKSMGPHSKLKSQFAELGCLEGYTFRSDFDLLREVKELANPRLYRIDSWDERFKQQCGESIPIPKTFKEELSFEEYVKGAKWLTSGSSSIGRVEWFYDEIKGHFKARKNMLLNIYTPEELWEIASKWDGRIVTKPLIKNELGKMRLAVASNIESYLAESYLLYCYGHDYKLWGTITLDERPKEEFERVQEMYRCVNSGWWALPWDFKSFDHQVSQQDIITIMSTLSQRAQDAGGSLEYQQLWDKVVASYSKTFVNYEGEHHVQNGLQSGQRTTSLIGNIWNYIVLKMCIDNVECLAEYNLSQSNMVAGVRGDDTYILSRSPNLLYLLRLSYQSLGAIGNNAKFSIRQFSVEFLRNEVSSKGQYGWANRALAAVTQRKPWASDDYDPITEVCIVADNIRNVERRLGFEVERIHHANKIQWSKFTRQTYKWLTIPKHMGGLGAYDFEGWIADKKLPLLKARELPISSSVVSTNNVFVAALGLDQIEFSRTQLGQLARSEVPVDIRTTDLFGRLSILRNYRVKFSKIGLPNSGIKPVNLVLRDSDWKPKSPYFSRERYQEHTFGQLVSFYNTASRFTRELPSLGKLVKRFFPNTYATMHYLEKTGFHRSMAVDLILGKIPYANCLNIHPTLIRFCQSQIIDQLDKYKQGRSKINLQLYSDSLSATFNVVNTTNINMFYKF